MEYVADESLRGNVPFPRVREEELLYVLRKLLELRLWPGTLWAALSDNPTKYAAEQPSIAETTMSGGDAVAFSRLVVADAVKRSSIAHLFHFYSVLVEIASKPRRTPVMAVSSDARNGKKSTRKQKTSGVADGGQQEPEKIVELDARVLARTCLKEMGKEISMSY